MKICLLTDVIKILVCLNQVYFELEKSNLYFYKQKCTRSLAPADFSGMIFTRAHFQKIVQISSLCNFHYVSEGISFFTHVFLVVKDFSAADLVYVDFARP